MTFNAKPYLIDVSGKAYLSAAARLLLWFRGQCPEGTIETELMHLDRETEEEVFQ